MAHLPLLALLLALLLANASAIRGDVVFDGSFGSQGQAPSGDGYDYVIDAGRGEARGSNLFFSFREFSIGGEESALLQDTSPGSSCLDGSCQHVVFRIPEVAVQWDGTLDSQIPDANLFVLAPHGIHFGDGAIVRVAGSLYLSTADSLVFEDGGRFDSRGQPWPSEDYCCAGAPGALRFEGVPDPGLEIPDIVFGSDKFHPIFPGEGRTLFASAGKVESQQSKLTTVGGTIYIAATGRAAVTVPLAANTDPRWLNGVGPEAQVQISGSDLNAEPNGTNPGGRVVLRGGELVITDGSTIVASGDYAHPTLEARATHTLKVSNSFLTIANSGTEDIPGTLLKAPQVRFDAGALLLNSKGSEIEIRADRLDLADAANLFTKGGGLIDIRAGSLGARNRSVIATVPSDPSNSTDIVSNAGNIEIEATTLNLENGSRIRSSALGDQSSGKIDIDVEGALSISGVARPPNGVRVSSGILARAGKEGKENSGAAGDIHISAGSLDVTAGGLISARSFGKGAAGSIVIVADGDVTVAGSSEGRVTEISVRTESGVPGDLSLEADGSVSIRDGAGLFATSLGSASGGSIQVKAEQDISLVDASVAAISVLSDKGGNITIDTGGRIELQNGRIDTQVSRDNGSGGNIRIGSLDAPRLMVLNASDVIARAAKGEGGDIEIHADTLLLSADSILDASSELGVDGSVDVAAPVVQVEGRLDPLPASFLDVRALLREHCALRDAEAGSSFVIEDGPAPPPSPRGYLASPPRFPASAGSGAREAAPSVGRQIAHFDVGCGRDWPLEHLP